MLTAIPVTYTDKRTAQTALTELRKRYRVAPRGAVYFPTGAKVRKV